MSYSDSVPLQTQMTVLQVVSGSEPMLIIEQNSRRTQSNADESNVIVQHNKEFKPGLSIDVDQFLGSIKTILGSLLERYTSAEITGKLGSSILATVFRQLVIHPCLMISELPFCVIIGLSVLNESNICSGLGR